MLELGALRLQCANGKVYQYLYFWSHRPSKTGEITKACLSQWHQSGFQLKDAYYPTAEHWMMAEKARLFDDKDSLRSILAVHDPKAAKALGRKVKNFDGAVWQANARRIVTEGNLAKFSQNEHLRTFLLGTDDMVLVEASPLDRIWGIAD